MFNQYKIYIYLTASIALVGIGATGAWKWQEVRYLQLENQIYADNQTDMKIQAIFFEKRIKDTENNRDKYLKQIQVAKDESNTFYNDLQSGRNWMRILVLRQKSCQAGQAANASGVESELAELSPTVQGHIHNFEQALIEREKLFNFCRDELMARSSL